MANKDNTLAHLGTNKIEAPALAEMFKLQMGLQERLGSWSDNPTIGEVADFCMFNKHALEDELSEFMDALGGNAGNAGWKKWKSMHSEIKNMHLSDLSDLEMLELKYEFVDMMHFIINFALIIGMSAEEVAGMYLNKNAENHNRQDNNY